MKTVFFSELLMKIACKADICLGFSLKNCMCKSISSYILLQLVHYEDHEVGVVVVHGGVLEGSVQDGTVLKQFLIPNCRCTMLKMFRSAKIPITCWGLLGWDCILELSDNHGTILKQIPSQNCTWKYPKGQYLLIYL